MLVSGKGTEVTKKERDRVRALILNLVVRSRHDQIIRRDETIVDYSEVDLMITELMANIGIVFRDRPVPEQTTLEADLMTHLQITPEIFGNLPENDGHFEYDAFFDIQKWGKEKGELTILHSDFYDNRGNITRPGYTVVKLGRMPTHWGALCLFRGQPHYVHFELNTYGGHWQIQSCGEANYHLLNSLREKVTQYFIEQFKGEVLDHKRNPVKLKLYAKEELVYPRHLQISINELQRCFCRWYKNSLVPRWGYLLIGGPGMGKTSVGGLLAAMRPKGCTTLYCPAGEIDNASDINEVFRNAKLLAPTLVIIDDVDLIAANRERDRRGLTSALMENLDGLREDENLFIIMITNDPSRMDRAIIQRAGRVSGKIVFEGYGECLPQLLRLGRDRFKLSLTDEVIHSAVASLPKEVIDLTPDEVMNVCKRLHLLHGKRKLGKKQLARAISEVYDAFHGLELNKSHLGHE